MTFVEMIALVAATVASGLSAGVFFTFQAAIMRGLAAVDDDAYVRTFQAINRTIVNGWFVSVFLGAPVLAAAALAAHWGDDASLVAALAIGLALNVATVGITVAGNIPLNEALDREGAVTGPAATAARQAFERPWNRLNLVRTITAVGGFAAFAIASVLAVRG